MGRTLIGLEGGERRSPQDPWRGLFRRILLVGFMGSGKTTVGSLLADELGWRFVDLDEAIELEEGRTIPTIFLEDGEKGFRRIEHVLAQRYLTEDGIVLASGGGWPCVEGRLEASAQGTLSIWLKVSPEEALGRVGRQGIDRPLLEVPDPLTRIRELLEVREPYYSKASWSLETELRAPRDIVRHVTDRLRADPERPLRA